MITYYRRMIDKDDNKKTRRDFMLMAGGSAIAAGLAYYMGPLKSFFNISKDKNLYSSDTTSPAGGYLESVISSACCDLDATIAKSYTAGQTWHNLIAKPADGAQQSAYDFLLGLDETETQDPEFKDGYWDTGSIEGGTKQFSQKEKTVPPLFRDMHKNNQSWWVAVAFRTPTEWRARSHSAFFGNVGSGWLDGIKLFYYETLDVVRCKRVASSPQNKQLFDPVTAGQLAKDRDYLLVVSQEADTQEWRAWLNSAKPTNIGKGEALENPQEATHSFGVMAGNAVGSNTWTNNGRFYHLSCGNEFLDNDKAAIIKSYLETRHGRAYA